ncbi:hypothetical protein P3X46_000007 [Hevea brasiliensis]|uniref:RNase H type-1 domain-containing protein n=1 Tax=Hevea brasiliensis TaxID=3981 RepID=A0ABQ9N7X7_HEVBR|nr:hypothetical protein P3X46_000007 [Hevea brasiliensis]
MGRLKCNVDAVLFLLVSKLGLGWIAGDAAGFMVATKVKSVKGRMSVMQAEAFSFREALSWIKDGGWRNVNFKSDSCHLAHAIHNSEQDISFVSSIVNDCKFFMQSIYPCSLGFVKKSANQSTHSLCRATIFTSDEKEWAFIPPSFLEDALRFDMVQ